MDGSNNAGGVNTSHLPRPNTTNSTYNLENSFLGGIQSFADATDTTSGNDDLSSFLHPDLFESADSGNSLPQQQQQAQQFQSAFNQHASRQSQSPALPQYNPSQQQTYSHAQYPHQPMFDGRTMYQQPQSFDPRLFQQHRPTQSPTPLDQFSYQAPSYNQNYLTQQPQQRQASTPSQQFPPPRQQTYSPFGGWDSRSTTNFGHYQSFPDQTQQTTHRFVDPSILNGSEAHNINGNYASLAPRQQYQPSPYFSKAGSGVTIDPRTLQPQQQFRHNQQQAAQQMATQTGVLVPPQAAAAVKTKSPKDPNASKRPRGRPRKDGSAPKQAGQSASDSDSDLLIEEEEPEMMPALLSVAMPTDLKGQVLYKAVDAVWAPRNKTAPLEKIKSGMADFGNAVRSYRDSWKAKNESLKKAELENSPTASQIPDLKVEVGQYRSNLELIVNRTLQYGHPAVLRSLGENQWVMSALYSFLLDRVTAGDFDSTLVAVILKLAINFETIDEEKLEAVKWHKLLQRLTKKSSSESKILAHKILSNAAAVTAKKKVGGDRDSPKPNGQAGPKDLAVGVKRSRDGTNGQPAPKKTLLKPSSKPLALQNAERRRAVEKEEAIRKAKETKEALTKQNGIAAIKSKAAVPSKTTAVASLMSASKKPGTSNAERAAAAKEKALSGPPIKKEHGKRESPPSGAIAAPKPQSSFMGFLEDLEKKDEVKIKREEEPRDETTEQRAKRLRKESRRKLRVSWKAEGELVEVREFTHDPDEEISSSDSMMKDAGDTMKEGEMLKRKMAMSDLEDEDEEDLSEETYSPPLEVDFSVFAGMPDVYVDLNGVKQGGPIKPESPSREAQDNFEAKTLMVVYDSKADRPDSPKEPPEDGDDDNFQPCIDFGEPDEKVRAKEREIIQLQQPPAASLNKLDLSTLAQQMAQSKPATQPQPGAQIDIQSILNNLQRSQPVAAPTAPTPAYDLKSFVDSVHKTLQPQQQYQPPPAPATSVDLTTLLAQYKGNQSSYPGKHGLDDGETSDSKKRKEAKPSNYKTQVCTFWQQGKCTKGDDCTYRHVS